MTGFPGLPSNNNQLILPFPNEDYTESIPLPNENSTEHKIKRTYSNQLSRQSSDLSSEMPVKQIQQSSKRQRRSVDIEQAVDSKQWDVLLDYFKENPEKLFKYADVFKSQLQSKHMVYSEFLPILSAAAENLKEKKTPVFAPLSVEITPPNSLFRLFGDELKTFIESNEYISSVHHFLSLLKQDMISTDSYLSSDEMPFDTFFMMVDFKGENRYYLLQEPDVLTILLPVLIEKIPQFELKELMSLPNANKDKLISTIQQKEFDNLSIENQIRLCVVEYLIASSADSFDPSNSSFKWDLHPTTKRFLDINCKSGRLNTDPPLLFKRVDMILKEFNEDEAFFLLALFIEIQRVPLKKLMKKFTEKEFLGVSTHLRYINLINFDNYSLAKKIIINSRNIEELKLSSGKIIEGFDELLCKKLILISCNDATALPNLPRCTLLKLNKCNKITHLPPVLNRIQVLELENCPSITEISSVLTNCESISLMNCKGLTQITSEFVKGDYIDISNCDNIARIDSPNFNCNHISINNCMSLIQLPLAFPKCVNFELFDCPLISSIDQLPELPLNANFQGELAEAYENKVSVFNVDVEKINTEPKKILIKFGEYLSVYFESPNLKYFSDGQPLEAIDAGGVTRDFITRLLENLFKTELHPSEHENFLRYSEEKIPYPAIRSLGEKEAYTAIGTLFGACYLNDSDFKTGPLFSSKVYQCLAAFGNVGIRGSLPSNEWLLNSYLVCMDNEKIKALVDPEQDLPELSEVDTHTIAYLLDEDNPPQITRDFFILPKNRELLRATLLDRAKNDPLLVAICWIAQEMKLFYNPDVVEASWKLLQDEGATILRNRIEGVLSKQELLAKLEWHYTPNVTPVRLQQTQSYLQNWIDQNDTPERLELFVYTVTGSRTLGRKDLKIEVVNRGPEYVPTASTCNYSLMISSEYANQEKFNHKLEILLEQGMAGGGFQKA